MDTLVSQVVHRDVRANGIRFHVAEAGEGDPVVCLHGWPQHWYVWRKVMPLLAGERRVICPDLRGHGASDTPARNDLRTMAGDVVPLLDALGLDRVDLIAHDWGGWIGFQLCLDHPERVRRYVALNIITPWVEPPSLRRALTIWRLWYQVAISTPGLGRLLLQRTDFVKRLITAGAVHPDAWTADDLEAFAAPLREPARARASQQIYRSFLLRELGPYLARRERRRLTVPTRMIHGTRDLAIDRRAIGAWREFADDMELELRDDSGHFIAEELPELVAERARAFFAAAN